MTMQSSSLLPALRELPGDESSQNRSFRENITGIVNMDRAMYAAEFASAVSFGMWYVFDENVILDINVPEPMPDTSVQMGEVLQLAYETRMENEAREISSVHEKFQELLNSGGDADNFIHNLKSQLSEFNATSVLEEQGNTNVELARSASQKGWDISFNGLDGQESLAQVKTGPSHSYTDFHQHMTANPNVETYLVSEGTYEDVVRAGEWAQSQDGVERQVTINNDADLEGLVKNALNDSSLGNTDYPFDLGSRIHEMLAEDIPFDELAAIGPNYELVSGTTDALSTLSDGLGIDVPDGVGEILPYAGAIFATARMIGNVLKTEKEFKAADRTTKNKIQVVQTLSLMSRMGPATLLSIVGGKGGTVVGGTVGTLAGTVVPGIGNAIGGAVGSIGGGFLGVGTGYFLGRYLGKHLQPHMLNLALNITGMTNDDLFYYKNKVRIDNVALGYRERAIALAAPA